MTKILRRYDFICDSCRFLSYLFIFLKILRLAPSSTLRLTPCPNTGQCLKYALRLLNLYKMLLTQFIFICITIFMFFLYAFGRLASYVYVTIYLNCFVLKVHPSSLAIEGTLGNFRLCDMSLGTEHCWGWLCDIRNPGVESLIKVHVISDEQLLLLIFLYVIRRYLLLLFCAYYTTFIKLWEDWRVMENCWFTQFHCIKYFVFSISCLSMKETIFN